MWSLQYDNTDKSVDKMAFISGKGWNVVYRGFLSAYGLGDGHFLSGRSGISLAKKEYDEREAGGSISGSNMYYDHWDFTTECLRTLSGNWFCCCPDVGSTLSYNAESLCLCGFCDTGSECGLLPLLD